MKARSDVIKDLEVIKALIEWEQPIDYQESLDYAIASLKTDKAYQIMYEGGEIYTKADMAAMLEELKEQLREMHEDFYETEHFDEAYGVSDSMDIIQQKINCLRGENDDKREH